MTEWCGCGDFEFIDVKQLFLMKKKNTNRFLWSPSAVTFVFEGDRFLRELEVLSDDIAQSSRWGDGV